MGADVEGTCGAESDPARVGRSVDRRASRPAMSRRPRRPRCRRCRQVPRALDPKKAEPGRGSGDRNRRHLALRRAWNDEHASATGPSSVRKRKCIEQGGRSGSGSVPSMVHNDGLPPLMRKYPLAEIRRATGLSTRYVIMIRKGLGNTAARDDINLGSETFKGEHRAKLNSAESRFVKGNAGIWRISIDGFCTSLLFTLSWPCFWASPWE